MVVGMGVWGIVVGVVGAVLVVTAPLLAGRRGARRSVGAAGAGLLLLGLALSGVVDLVVQAVAVGLNPVRWVGLAAAALGLLMLASVGMLPGAARRQRAGKRPLRAKHQVESNRGRQPTTQPQVDDDMAEIEDILRRRGIQ